MASWKSLGLIVLIALAMALLYPVLKSLEETELAHKLYASLERLNPELADFMQKLYGIAKAITGIVYFVVTETLDVASRILDTATQALSQASLHSGQT